MTEYNMLFKLILMMFVFFVNDSSFHYLLFSYDQNLKYKLISKIIFCIEQFILCTFLTRQ